MGPGERRDACAHYNTCLTTFVRRNVGTRGEPEGHCPVSCSAYRAVPIHVRLGIASTSKRTNFS
jgi:hypothetical protein